MPSTALIQSKRLSASTKRWSRGRQKMSATLTTASWTCADTTSMSSLSRATSLSSSGHALIRDRLFSALSKLGKPRVGRKPRRRRNVCFEHVLFPKTSVRFSLERDTGNAHDNDDQALPEFALVSLHDGIEPRLVIVVAGQYDFDALCRFAHDPAVGRVAPLSGRIGDGQAVGEARRQFTRDEPVPRGFADADAPPDVAAEQNLGDLFRSLRAGTRQRGRLGRERQPP